MKIKCFAVIPLLLLSACTVFAGMMPAATAMPTVLPTETPTPAPQILEVFPLSLGATWKYAAEIEYQDPDDLQETLTWNGVITVSVVDQETSPDGQTVFTLEEVLEPTPPRDVWRQSSSYQYLVEEGEIFQASEKIIQWPLADKMSWTTWPDFEYQTEVSYQGNVETPYGLLKDCYQVFILTGPDVQIEMFCPGVGFVQHHYHHFGTPQDENFELVSFEPGK